MNRYRGEPSVLLVDDDREFHLLWRLILENSGGFGAIHDADDGYQASIELERHCPDVVITDYSMPGMSGFEVIDAARWWCPDAVIVMASGTDDVGDEAVRRGATAFMTKFSSCTEELPTLIHALLTEARARRVRPYEQSTSR